MSNSNMRKLNKFNIILTNVIGAVAIREFMPNLSAKWRMFLIILLSVFMGLLYSRIENGCENEPENETTDEISITTTIEIYDESQQEPIQAVEQPITPEITSDNVDHPAHYTSGNIECIDALEAATSELTGIEAVCTANAIKYLWRWKQKNGVEDLKKSKWYIEHIINKLKG